MKIKVSVKGSDEESVFGIIPKLSEVFGFSMVNTPFANFSYDAVGTDITLNIEFNTDEIESA